MADGRGVWLRRPEVGGKAGEGSAARLYGAHHPCLGRGLKGNTFLGKGVRGVGIPL